MKKIILGLVTALILTAANASDEMTSDEKCIKAGELAEVIMINRQSGTEASEMMSIAGDNDFIRRIVRESFAVPKYSTKEFQYDEVAEFKSRIYLECLAAFER